METPSIFLIFSKKLSSGANFSFSQSPNYSSIERDEIEKLVSTTAGGRVLNSSDPHFRTTYLLFGQRDDDFKVHASSADDALHLDPIQFLDFRDSFHQGRLQLLQRLFVVVGRPLASPLAGNGVKFDSFSNFGHGLLLCEAMKAKDGRETFVLLLFVPVGWFLESMPLSSQSLTFGFLGHVCDLYNQWLLLSSGLGFSIYSQLL
jgi:hypothetical protein